MIKEGRFIELDPAAVEEIAFGLDCPGPGCDGKLLTEEVFETTLFRGQRNVLERKKVVKISCFKCGERIDQERVLLYLEGGRG